MIPGYKRSDIQLLPSSTTKRAVWRVYLLKLQVVSSGTVVLKPRSNLCWQCQQNSASIVCTANSSEAEKSTVISDALEHLRIVKLERSYYKSVCDECKGSVHAHYNTDGKFTPPQSCSQTPRNSKNIKAHYSFDYAQQVPPIHCSQVPYTS